MSANVTRAAHTRDPANCAATNVTALRGLLDIAIRAARRPWVVFVSSREVYGNAAGLPVEEEAPLRPMNVYARTKCDGELLARQARDAGPDHEPVAIMRQRLLQARDELGAFGPGPHQAHVSKQDIP